MPWNEPDSGDKDKDPWGQKNQGGRNQAPPDLDELLRQAKNKVDNLFGGRGGNKKRGNDAPPSGSGGMKISKSMVLLVSCAAFAFWLFQGVYTVDEGEQALELRFGKFSELNDAGLNWHWPAPFETVNIINTQNVNTVEVGYRQGSGTSRHVPQEALMLTQDENIIDIQFAVQYDIKNPKDLLFNVSEYNPRDLADTVVRQATESAVREIVGRNTMDFAITEGRAELAAETRVLVQEILDRYKTGINIRTVEMQNAQPPVQVKDAFDDAVRAREDEEKLKNLAQAYANDIIPRARGFAGRIFQEAEAYKASIIAKAEGETARFAQVLNEYSKAPKITRDRLYLETMEEVFSNTSKMVIDQQGGGNNVMYLPLDQLTRGRGSSHSVNTSGTRLNTTNSNDNSDFNSNSLRSTDRNVDRTTRQ